MFINITFVFGGCVFGKAFPHMKKNINDEKTSAYGENNEKLLMKSHTG